MKKKFFLGGVDTVPKARLPKQCGLRMIEVGTLIGKLLEEEKTLEGAPFQEISMILRFGLDHSDLPCYIKLRKKAAIIEVSMKLTVEEVKHAAARGEVHLYHIFLLYTLHGLIHIFAQYNLPHQRFITEKQMLEGVMAAETNDKE